MTAIVGKLRRFVTLIEKKWSGFYYLIKTNGVKWTFNYYAKKLRKKTVS